MIKFVNITKSYQTKSDKFYALKNISLTINKGTSLGVVGSSGAGKSTLIRLINGLIKPTEGKVLIDGVNINEINLKALNKLRKNIGMVFQHFNLFSSLTVFENVKLALTKSTENKTALNYKVIEVLKFVGLEHKSMSYPSNLSGGEKQRVSIARAIINNPKYLLLDEITSALDQKTAYEILDVINNIKDNYNMTIVFISHQLEMIRKICDEVVILNKGEIVEHNSITNLYLKPKSEEAKTLIPLLKEAHKYEGHNRYLLTYSSDAINKTILNDVINQFRVTISIILAETIVIKEKTIGYLIIDLKGDNRNDALLYLKSENIKIKTLKEEKLNDSI